MNRLLCEAVDVAKNMGDDWVEEVFYCPSDRTLRQQENTAKREVRQQGNPRHDVAQRADRSHHHVVAKREDKSQHHVVARREEKSQHHVMDQRKELSDFMMLSPSPPAGDNEWESLQLQAQFGDVMTPSFLGDDSGIETSSIDLTDFVFAESPGFEFNDDDEPDFVIISQSNDKFDAPWRGLPLNAQEWASFFDANGSLKDADVQHIKKTIFRGGIDPEIRSEVWKYLLGYYAWDSTKASRKEVKEQKLHEYFCMKQQWLSMSPKQLERFRSLKEHMSMIEKDVFRTDRSNPHFAGNNNPNLKLLSDILMTYCIYNFDLGYAQGMNDLLSPILVVMQDEEEAFWCFSGLMDRMGCNFEMGQKETLKQQKQLEILLWYHDFDLYVYLEKQEFFNLFCCFRWIFILFKREFPFDEIPHLWEVIWTGLPCRNFHLLFAVAMLDSQRSAILESRLDFIEIFGHINKVRETIPLVDLLKKAEEICLKIMHSDTVPSQIQRILGIQSPAPSSSTPSKPAPSSSTPSKDGTPDLQYPRSIRTPADFRRQSMRAQLSERLPCL